MDYKEKYEQALGRAKTFSQRWQGIEATDSELALKELKEIFPELKESEDEKIRKTLKSFFDSEISDYGNVEWRNGIRYGEIVSWLEKQGKQKPVSITDEQIEDYWKHYKVNNPHSYDNGDEIQFDHDGFVRFCKQFSKPADKVEPKFKIGDWIVSNRTNKTYKIDSIDTKDANYIIYSCVPSVYTNEDSPCFSESMIHLWTIQDAKDGDVLWHSDTASHGTFIFKQIRYDGKVLCYCDYDSEDHFCTGEHHTCCWSSDKCIKPATKEQRDTLFTKMKESGYEWDAEKKELKKIEQKPAENKGMNLVEDEMTPFQKKVFFIIDTTIEEEQGLKQVCDELLRLAHDEIMQTLAWSEEDEHILEAIIKEIEANKTAGPEYDEKVYDMFLSWLKSLKVRIQHQHKQEWSEEDWKYYHKLEMFLEVNEHYSKTEKSSGYQKDVHETLSWLKSLKQRMKGDKML